MTKLEQETKQERKSYEKMMTEWTRRVSISKVYPTCKCGRKYVPIKKYDPSQCIICYFKTAPIVKTNVCKKCGREDIRLKRKTVYGLCSPCETERVKEYNTKHKRLSLRRLRESNIGVV